MNTVICFFLFFPYTLWYSIWLAFRRRTKYKCQIIVSTARVVGIKLKFRETALIFKSLKCGRTSEVKSTFFRDISSSTLLDRCSGFVVVVRVVMVVSVVLFRSINLAVLGFSTCQLEGCNDVWVKFLKRPSIAHSLHGETITFIIPIIAVFRSINIWVICFCFILL